MRPMDAMRRALRDLPELELQGTQDAPVAYRRRIIPTRGIVRLLFPRAVVRFEGDPAHGRLVARPDGWAYASSTFAIGGLVVELLLDRARYPRDYPPAAVAFVAVTVVGALLVDLAWAHRLLARRGG